MAVSSFSSFKLASDDVALSLYGVGYSSYGDRCKNVVELALNQLQATPMTPEYINKLFFQLIDSFGRDRNAIAKESNSPEFELFGKKRAGPNPIVMAYANTVLEGQYEPFAKDILKLFAECIKKLDLSTQQSTREIQVIKEGDYSFECQVFEMNDMIKAKFGIVPAYNEMPAKFRSSIEGRINGMGPPERGTYISKEIKNQLPAFYHHTILNGLLLKVEKKYSFVPPLFGLLHHQEKASKLGKESIFLQGTARVKIQNKMYATSKYYTWINFNKDDRASMTTEAFIENMEQFSKVIVMHQDQFLIDETVKEIAKIFTQAVLLNIKEDQELIKLMSKFRHLFANCMIYFRGSAAIGEWFEKLVYLFHNKKLKYRQNIDLVALTTPIFSDFLKQYSDMIELS